jgi:hypothetical protein
MDTEQQGQTGLPGKPSVKPWSMRCRRYRQRHLGMGRGSVFGYIQYRKLHKAAWFPVAFWSAHPSRAVPSLEYPSSIQAPRRLCGRNGQYHHAQRNDCLDPHSSAVAEASNRPFCCAPHKAGLMRIIPRGKAGTCVGRVRNEKTNRQNTIRARWVLPSVLLVCSGSVTRSLVIS